jgi:hypothetical protein
MADNSASTPVAAAPTNTPASATGSPSPGDGAAGAAASAVTANAHPTITGIVSRRAAGQNARAVIEMKTDNASAKMKPREAAPATDPKAGDGKASGQEASSSTKDAPPSSEKTGETPKDTKDDTGKNADDKAKPKVDAKDAKDSDEPDPNSRRGKSWAELQEREAELVTQKKALAEERKAIAAELAERKEVNELIKQGKLMAAAKKLGITLKALNEEYLRGVDEDPAEVAARAAEEKVKQLKEAELAEVKAKADEEVKKHTEKATREVKQLYGSMEEELKAAAETDYSAIRAFGLSPEQTLQVAQAELNRIPAPDEGKDALTAAQAFFHKKILAAGYVKKTDVPAPTPAAPAADNSPRSLTNGRNEVPLVPRNTGKRTTVAERLAEGLAKHGLQ